MYIRILLILITLLAQISVSFGQVKGNGNVVTQERNIGSFTGIEINGASEIFLTQGNSVALSIETDENLQEYISSEVKGNTLVVRNTKDIKRQTRMKLYITVKDLELIELNGATELECKGKLKLKDLEIGLNGASKLKLEVAANEIKTHISGAGQATFEGDVNELSARITGAGEINAYDLEADKVSVDVSGAGSARVYANATLDVDISGVAKVKYKGSPKISKNISGMGQLSAN